MQKIEAGDNSYFLLNGLSFQKGIYEPVYKDNLFGIRRAGTSGKDSDYLVTPIRVDLWTDDTDTPLASVQAMSDYLATFFFRNVGGGGGGAGNPYEGQEVDVFSNLPDPVANNGQYWLVNEASGRWILANRKNAGVYKAVAGVWDYRGPDVPYYLLDNEFSIKDTDDNTKQIGFQVDQIATGERRIATWQDKDIVVADDADLDQEVIDRQNADTTLQNNIDTNTAGIAAQNALNTGSVTVHNDVSDAGSGEIITPQERTDINASIDVHDDVDLNNFVESPGDVLKWNGADWVPVLKEVFSNEALTINNTNVLQDIINVQVNIQRLVPHKITISYGWSLNDAGQDFIAEASLDGQDLVTGLTDNTEIHRQEPKDTAGADPDGRGTNQRHRFTGVFFVTPTNLGNNQLLLQIAGSGNGDLASIWNCYIEVEEQIN